MVPWFNLYLEVDLTGPTARSCPCCSLEANGEAGLVQIDWEWCGDEDGARARAGVLYMHGLARVSHGMGMPCPLATMQRWHGLWGHSLWLRWLLEGL